jgi:hypothetical protein
MQRTSNALKAMGLDKSLKDVDKVMLDLEENHSDVSSLQQTLGMSYADDESVDWGLELSMLLNDDCGAPPVLANVMQEAEPVRPPADAAPRQREPAEAREEEKKIELAVVDV